MNFQDNEIWELKDGERLLRHMVDQYLNEPDQFRASGMRSHLVTKLHKAQDNALARGIPVPAWIETLLDVL